VAVIFGAVFLDLFDTEGKELGGKVRDFDVWQNEESVILGDQMEVYCFDRVRPTDEPISAGDPPGWGAEAQAAHDLILYEGHVFEVSTNDLAVAQVVVVMDEAIIEGFEGGMANHF
jgi:hypothetical protein